MPGPQMNKTLPELRALHGVGPRLLASLQQMGIHSIPGLLFHLPFRYEDRTRILPIGSLYPGCHALVEGIIEHVNIVRGRRAMLVVILADGTGLLTLRFFHFRNAQKQQMSRGTRLRCYGEARAGYRGLEMVHPSYQRLPETGEHPVSDRLTPIYPSTEGLGQHTWMRLTDQALEQLAAEKLKLDELLPEDLLEDLSLPGLAEALQYIHRPPVGADVSALVERRHPCQQRLALEELLAHNLSMRQLHQHHRRLRAPTLNRRAAIESRFLASLPFLTGTS